MRRLVLVVLCLSVIAAFAPPAAAARQHSGFTPEYQPADCWADPPEGVAAQELRCGYVTVPLDHADPDGPTIRLATVVVSATAPAPRPDPVLALTGGPGDTLLTVLPLFSEAGGPWPALRAERDVILFDQRGVGLSEPQLSCPELILDPASRPEDPDEAQEVINAAARACRDRLSQVTDLDAYDTQQNSADLDLVRQALGYDQVNLYGISYGSKLGYQTLRGNPEWIRSAILASPIPHRPNWQVKAPTTFQGALDTLHAACAADPACTQAYGDLEEKTAAVVERLAAQPAVVPLTDAADGPTFTVTADDFVNYLYQFLYPAPTIQALPQLISGAEAGDFSILLSLLGVGATDQAPAPEPTAAVEEPNPFENSGLYYSIICSEEVAYSSPQQVRTRNQGVSPLVEEYFIPSHLISWELCDVWDVEPASPLFMKPVHSRIPTLVVAGAFDPITPPRYGEIMARSLRDSQLVVASSVGHSPLEFLGACAATLVTAFLAAPGVHVDDACAQQPIEFTLPSTGG